MQPRRSRVAIDISAIAGARAWQVAIGPAAGRPPGRSRDCGTYVYTGACTIGRARDVHAAARARSPDATGAAGGAADGSGAGARARGGAAARCGVRLLQLRASDHELEFVNACALPVACTRLHMCLGLDRGSFVGSYAYE